MTKLLISLLTTIILMSQSYYVMSDENTINSLMKSYQSQGVKSGDAQRGEQFWNRTFSGKAPFTERSCKLCHTANLKTLLLKSRNDSAESFVNVYPCRYSLMSFS